MNQNKNYPVICLIGLCRGVGVFMAALFCSKRYGRAVEKVSLRSQERLCHSDIILQCCLKDAQAGFEKLVSMLSRVQRCCLETHHLPCQISVAFQLAEKQGFYLTTGTSKQTRLREPMRVFPWTVANAVQNWC